MKPTHAKLVELARLVVLGNNEGMTSPETTGRALFAKVACTCFRLLGGLALLTATWEFVRLAGGLGAHPGSVAAWLNTFFAIILIVIWGAAGINLVRGRTSGWFTLCVLSCFSYLSCGFQPASFLHPWLCLWVGPLPFAADEFLTGPLALLFFFLLIVTRLAVHFSEPPRPPLSSWTWPRRVVLVLALSVLFASWWRAQEYLDLAAQDLVQEAWSASSEMKDDEAEAILRHVIAEYPFTTTWSQAMLTYAQQRQSRGQYHEAIMSYEILFGSRLGDCTPAPRLFDRWRDERNLASLGLAECYEFLGDYRQALRYARLADAAYRCRSWCGTCKASVSDEARQRVERLQALLE
jgi:hypothetical protein